MEPIAWIKSFVTKYPAMIAGIVIYAYYMMSTMNFYVAFKHRHLSTTESLAHFDTLLWMWTLAFVLVKVIELRERIHAREHAMEEQHHAIALHETQMQTLRDVTSTLKHEINNPLAIILGYIHLMKRGTPADALKHVNDIESAAQRIQTSLKEYSALTTYDTADSPAGKYVKKHPLQPQPAPREK